MSLRLEFFGGCALIASDGARLRLKTRKSWALLALLAQAKDLGCTREYLASLLWPRSGEEQARASLRQELAVLRRLFAEYDIDVFDSQNDVIRLQRDQIDVDSVVLEHDVSQGPGDVRKIMALYQGDFAAGLNIRSAPFDDWLWLERERLRELATGALQAYLLQKSAEVEPQDSLDVAQAIIDIDPTYELAHQHLIQALDDLGRRADALSHFSRLQEIMRRELDAEPSEETFALYHRLRDRGDDDVHRETTAQSWQQDALRSEKRELTVAAFGIANPTNFHEALGAEDVSDLLSEMEALCKETIPKFGGTFLGIIGDRCLAIFGYPKAGELMAERSVFTALELTSRILPSAFHGAVQICCGIANGETLISAPEGQHPAPRHLSGAAVTQATTLSFMAAGGQVLINATTKALLRYAFKTEQVAALSAGNAAFQVLGEQEVQNRFDVSERSKTLSQFIGRSRELSRLRALWDKTLAGEGTAAFITGEPGIGKSRLVHAFLRNIIGDGVTCVQFNGSAHHQNTALFPVAEELRRMLDLDPSTPRDLLTRKVTRWLSKLRLKSNERARHLVSLLSGELEEAPEKPNETLVQCFTKLASDGPTLFIFEDLHWMDPSSIELVVALQNASSDRAIMVLATSRLEPLADHLGTDPRHVLPLKPLRADHARALARSLRPDHLDDAHIKQIIALSDGIPLFLEELIHSIAEAPRATLQPGRADVVPASLQETLMARIDRMGREKDILHIAAVIGRDFSGQLLRSVAPHDADHVDAYLAKLQKQDLVYRMGPAPTARDQFKHALVQELTYRSILRDDRRKYHQKVAKALKATGGLSATEPEVIARHLEKAGQTEQALDYLELAGRQAVAISAHKEAVQHFQRALLLAGGLSDDNRTRKLLLLLGPQLLAQTGFASDEVRAVYDQAKSLSVGDDDKVQFNHVLWGLWSNYIVRPELDIAREASREFLQIALATHHLPNTVAGHYMTGVSEFYAGKLVEAEIAFDQVNKEYLEDLHDEMTLRFGLNLNVAATSYLLWIYALTGRFDKARKVGTALIAETEKINHSVSAGFAHNFISRMYNFAGQPDVAEHHARAAIKLSEGQQFAQFRAQADINLGRALDQQGQSKGLVLMQQGLAGYLETGAELAKPYAFAWLAEACMRNGAPDEARQYLVQARDFSERTGEAYFDAEVLRFEAVLCAQNGSIADAKVKTCFAQALSAARDSGASTLEITAAASFARFLRDKGQADAAYALAKDVATPSETTLLPVPVLRDALEVLQGG